uniref:Uncharacterized protein n=1 Tax=Ciona intestinalis TaxID=7719 RepID=H2XQN9_CIOIN
MKTISNNLYTLVTGDMAEVGMTSRPERQKCPVHSCIVTTLDCHEDFAYRIHTLIT